MAVNAMSGLIFYNESKYMETWQIILMSVGVFIIVIGLIVGLRENQKQKSMEPCIGFQETDKSHILEPIQDKDEPLVSLRQPSQAVEVVYALARTSTTGLTRADTYDDELFKTSRSHRSISITSIDSAKTSRTRLSFKDITIEHGVDLPDTRGIEVI